MAYTLTLNTTPKIGINVVTNNVLGEQVYLQAFNADTGVQYAGKFDVHYNAMGPWEQLKDILNYCGRSDITSAAIAQTWFKAQTSVTFITAIRKYLEEVFFPNLITWLNKFVTGAPNTSATLNTMVEGWAAVLNGMTVTYGADGKISKVTI